MSTRKKRRTYTRDEFIQRYVHRHMEETGTAHNLNLNDITQAFLNEGLWQESRLSQFKRCKRAIARALTHDMVVDEVGRSVRRMHAVRKKDVEGQTYWEWADIFAAKPDHMRLSLSQRRRDISGRVAQHDVDRKFYNRINKFGAEIEPFDYNFNNDRAEELLAEEHGGEYPDEKPAD